MKRPVDPTKPRILFHTIADHSIGMGHVARGLSLAEAFQEICPRAQPLFGLPAEGEAPRWIRSAGFPVHVGPSTLNVDADLAVVDLPLPVEGLYPWFHSRQVFIVAIDDRSPERLHADLAFFMLYEPPWDSCASAAGRECSGFRFFPLRREYRGLPRKDIPRVGRNVLILQGGSDTYGVTPKLCRWIRPVPTDVVFEVALGAEFRHREELMSAVDGDPRFRLHWGLPSLLPLMKEADVAVSAAGISAFELAAVGVPSILLVTEPSEEATATRLDGEGLSIYLGRSEDVATEVLRDGIVGLLGDHSRRLRMSRKAQDTVDGQGALRAARTVLSAWWNHIGCPETPPASLHQGCMAESGWDLERRTY